MRSGYLHQTFCFSNFPCPLFRAWIVKEKFFARQTPAFRSLFSCWHSRLRFGLLPFSPVQEYIAKRMRKHGGHIRCLDTVLPYERLRLPMPFRNTFQRTRGKPFFRRQTIRSKRFHSSTLLSILLRRSHAVHTVSDVLEKRQTRQPIANAQFDSEGGFLWRFEYNTVSSFVDLQRQMDQSPKRRGRRAGDRLTHPAGVRRRAFSGWCT